MGISTVKRKTSSRACLSSLGADRADPPATQSRHPDFVILRESSLKFSFRQSVISRSRPEVFIEHSLNGARCGEQEQQQASCFIPFFLNEHRGLPLFCPSTCSTNGVGFLLPCGLAIHHQNEDSVVHCSLQHHCPGWQAPRRARPQKYCDRLTLMEAV